MSLHLQAATRTDAPQVEAVLQAADLGSRQRAFLDLMLDSADARTVLAWQEGRPVATALAVSFGLTGWIGNVAVHPEERRAGVGTRVTEAAMTWLRERGARSIRLLATDLGRPVYERLGFVVDGEPWDKFTVVPVSAPKGTTGVHPICLEDALAVDHGATGEDRRAILAPLADRLVGPDRGEGYALALPWGGGPVVASDPDAAHALWWHVYARTSGVRWALPAGKVTAKALARAYGLAHAGTSLPMRYGPVVAAAHPERLWAAWSLAVG